MSGFQASTNNREVSPYPDHVGLSSEPPPNSPPLLFARNKVNNGVNKVNSNQSPAIHSSRYR